MPYLHINSSSSITWNSAPLLPEIYLHKVQYNWYTKCLLHILQVTNSFPQQLLFVKLHSSLNLHFFIQKQTQPSLCQKDDLEHSWRLSNNLPLSNSGSVRDVQGKNFCQQILAICSNFPYRKNLFDLAMSHLWTSSGSICIIWRIPSDRSCPQKLLWNLVNWTNMPSPWFR